MISQIALGADWIIEIYAVCLLDSWEGDERCKKSPSMSKPIRRMNATYKSIILMGIAKAMRLVVPVGSLVGDSGV